MSNKENNRFTVQSFEGVKNFDVSADVLVCGFGGAGGSAAFEAALAGAEVVLF